MRLTHCVPRTAHSLAIALRASKLKDKSIIILGMSMLKHSLS